MAAALRCAIGRSASAVAVAIPRASWLPWAHSRLALGMVSALRSCIGRSQVVSRHWIMLPQSPISLIGAPSTGLNTWKAATKTSTLVTNCSSTRMFTSGSPPAMEIFPLCLEENSSHRDGAIYKNTDLLEYWDEVNIDITNRNETRLEPMMCSRPFKDNMLQCFSVTLAQSPSNGSVQIYGYIAVRDEKDGLLNYIVKYSRDDPAVVHQGSLIEMTGPKRGIGISSPVLMEVDLRIINGGHEEDDMTLIDGAVDFMFHIPVEPLKYRITGKYGAVDVALGFIVYAVEATIEVVISEVQRDFSLFLGSLVYVVDEYEEIHLFHGTIDRSCDLRRFVVAVPFETNMILKFKVGNDNDAYYHSFKAMDRGYACHQKKFEFGTVSAKVTWSTLVFRA